MAGEGGLQTGSAGPPPRPATVYLSLSVWSPLYTRVLQLSTSANSLHESCLCPAHHVYTLIVWNKSLYSCHPAGVGVGMSNW